MKEMIKNIYTESKFKNVIRNFQEMVVTDEYGRLIEDVALPSWIWIYKAFKIQERPNEYNGMIKILLKGKSGIEDVTVYRNSNFEIVTTTI